MNKIVFVRQNLLLINGNKIFPLMLLELNIRGNSSHILLLEIRYRL